jgi:hypothetical protein
LKEYSMAKISVFGGVTDVHASGLLPGVADELPVQVVDRADGSVSVVNDEFDQDADPDEARSPNADVTGQGSTNPPPNDSGRGPTPDTSTPDTTPAADGSQASGPADGVDPDSGEKSDSGKRDNSDAAAFDPGDFTVNEVKAKLEGLPDDERARVIAAERAGKDRAGITG